jgi:hypothetical protein
MDAKKIRKFEDSARLVSRSLVEIRQAMEDESTRVRRSFTDDTPKIGDKPFGLTQAVNALVVGYLLLPEEQRNKIMASGIECLAKLIGRDGPDPDVFAHIQRTSHHKLEMTGGFALGGSSEACYTSASDPSETVPLTDEAIRRSREAASAAGPPVLRLEEAGEGSEAEASSPRPNESESVPGRRRARKTVHPNRPGRMIVEPDPSRKDVAVGGKGGTPPKKGK